uniref:metal ABC transporter substrate-binding protein n=1 Tax=Thaumasiovibrio occultus TaxID=1891184 RepID=UPI000B351C1C|nr:metal ABC transporter substrate-binding protein [Thaumasiovibrio occultus]
MTRLLLAIFSAVLLMTAPSMAFAKLKVATTFTILQDMVEQVAGEHADVVSVTKPGAEIHDYQPTPQDIVRIYDADLIIWNGLNLERWFEKFYTQLDNVPVVVISDGIEPMSINSGPYSGKPNPHAWMSVPNALIYVDNITAALSEYDPDNAEYYRANAQAYRDTLLSLDEQIRDELANIPDDKRWLVTSEGAFSYFARDYQLQEAYLWPINADQQGTPQQVSGLIEMVRENSIPTVFSESTVSPKPAQQVSSETDAHYGGVLYVDSLSEQDGVVPTYLDLLKVTSRTITKGLSHAAQH